MSEGVSESIVLAVVDDTHTHTHTHSLTYELAPLVAKVPGACVTRRESEPTRDLFARSTHQVQNSDRSAHRSRCSGLTRSHEGSLRSHSELTHFARAESPERGPLMVCRVPFERRAVTMPQGVPWR